MKEDRQVKYVLYVRKSSESEDRQVQSIQDQFDRLNYLAKDRNLKIIKVYKESKSAKQPTSRPLFAEMLEFIKANKANGILCWQINRLSRNPVDSGEISWLLQNGIIQSIQTIDREYRPEDNVLMFNMESGMANQFILDLKKNTKRGLESKVQKGWCPYRAPAGYMNDVINKTITKDLDRFVLIKKMWELVVSSNTAPAQTLKVLNNDWGYLSRKTKRDGGRPMSVGEFYKILNNPFYYGYFRYKGELYQGNHEPMITIEQFDQVQEKLGNKLKGRRGVHDFAFTGIMICGTCGCQITAEEKTKYIKSLNSHKSYTYYRCTHRKNNIFCQEPPITLGELETQIKDELEKFAIHPAFKDWALRAIKEMNAEEINNRQAQYKILEKKYVELQRQLDNLTHLRLKELIDDEEFIKEKRKLNLEISSVRQKLGTNQDRGQDWVEILDRAFTFATGAREAFNCSDIKAKRNILATIGQNYVLKDKKLAINPVEWLIPLYKEKENINKHFSTLEPQKTSINTNKNTSFEEEMLLWGV